MLILLLMHGVDVVPSDPRTAQFVGDVVKARSKIILELQ
jgi:hypothetical protein